MVTVDIFESCRKTGSYGSQGFTVFSPYTIEEVAVLQEYSRLWLYNLFAPAVPRDENKYPLERYHVWKEEAGIPHGDIFKAANRHRNPPLNITKILLNDRVKEKLVELGIYPFTLWDEGLGWLAFRFIRPGCGDGYPWSRKEWGPAKTVVSAWIPVIGFSENETLNLIPGSHIREYEKYLPSEGKFRKDEYRLVNSPSESEMWRPSLSPGEIILYHPRLIHSEDVEHSSITRLSLEFRILPQG